MVFRTAETFSARALSREMPSSDLGGGQLLAHSVHLQIANLSVKARDSVPGGTAARCRMTTRVWSFDGQSRSEREAGLSALTPSSWISGTAPLCDGITRGEGTLSYEGVRRFVWLAVGRITGLVF